ncbi:hypothetical protein RSJ22_17540 [Clostridium botulinum]|nr:hypothetical protein NPD3_1845 [Clostridium botulinum]APH22353.1 hypothetical protein NPD1_703 [Clostridium botulinum]AUN23147.1 hypothetical protein RSJ22_17540 [Clostridium botulinum]MBN3372173.1 hypothetical protein [Clostridium botulinum]MBN3375969.1 hypothetical protein [Clostridium botulinum]
MYNLIMENGNLLGVLVMIIEEIRKGFTVNEVSKIFKLNRLDIYTMIVNKNIKYIKTSKILIPSSELKKIAHIEN